MGLADNVVEAPIGELEVAAVGGGPGAAGLIGSAEDVPVDVVDLDVGNDHRMVILDPGTTGVIDDPSVVVGGDELGEASRAGSTERVPRAGIDDLIDGIEGGITASHGQGSGELALIDVIDELLVEGHDDL